MIEKFKKIGVLCCFFVLSISKSHGQNVTYKSNKELIDCLDSASDKICQKSYRNKISKKQIKKDEKVIEDLNLIYKMANDSLVFDKIKKRGFYFYSQLEDANNKTTEFAKNAGNLRVTVKIILDSKKNEFSKTIEIMTNTKFHCETISGSYLIYLIDFVYIKKVIKKIEFPLQVSSFCSALISQ